MAYGATGGRLSTSDKLGFESRPREVPEVACREHAFPDDGSFSVDRSGDRDDEEGEGYFDSGPTSSTSVSSHSQGSLSQTGQFLMVLSRRSCRAT